MVLLHAERDVVSRWAINSCCQKEERVRLSKGDWAVSWWTSFTARRWLD